MSGLAYVMADMVRRKNPYLGRPPPSPSGCGYLGMEDTLFPHSKNFQFDSLNLLPIPIVRMKNTISSPLVAYVTFIKVIRYLELRDRTCGLLLMR